MYRLVTFSCLFLVTLAASSLRGKPTEQRIIGGRNTEITEVPYQVSVIYKRKHVCGGAIVGPKHILTAAHCLLTRDETRFLIRAGSNHHDKEGQTITVVRTITHPKFSIVNGDYDAAVLVLKEPLKLGKGVEIATFTNAEPKEGEMILISGWGEMSKGTGPATHLQSVEVPVVSRKSCKQKYRGRDITDRMFCAGHSTPGKDSCKGDSGGPAAIRGKLAGIVSWGEDCGDPKFPGVYTNIVTFLPWITAQTRQ